MTGFESTHALTVMLVGATIVASTLVRIALVRTRVPTMVGFLVLGLLLRWLDDGLGVMTEPVSQGFEVFADLGVIVLLFRVGLDSNLHALLAKLPRAAVIWMGDVTVAATAGFLAAYYLGGLSLLPALVVATALSATSAGVSTAIWQEARALHSPTGRLLIDVAELDDVSAVVVMTLLFSVLPALVTGEDAPWSQLAGIAGLVLLTLLGFMAICTAFAVLLEPRVTGLASRAGTPSLRMLVVAGLGFMIAAVADWLGLSLAIGALCAGLVFSRDPQAVRTETRFEDLYSLFVPFFFIRIGLQTDLAALAHVAGFGSVLLAAAIVGKFLGAGLPAWLVAGRPAGLLIGLSMIPRAEIAMVVVDAARRLGPVVMPPQAYAAMVVTVLGTCLVTPWLLNARFRALAGGRLVTA